MAFEEFYQEIIRDHYKNPRNKEALGDDVPTYQNPSCGDLVKLKLEVSEQGILEKVAFDGSGCSISMCSASMMTDLLSGKPVQEASDILDHFLEIIRGEKPAQELEELGELAALGGVIQLPVRVKCATLAWNALGEALQSHIKENA